MRTFALAPMSPSIRWLTLVLWVLPIAFGGIALATGSAGGWWLAFGLVALYGAVWLGCRPSRFVVSARGFEVVFPVWTRSIPAQGLRSAREISRERFRQEFGWAMRVGVGGLWGGFGWLWTQRGGMIEFYVSRLEDLVLVERHKAKPLLVTPVDPGGMVRGLRELLGRSASG